MDVSAMVSVGTILLVVMVCVAILIPFVPTPAARSVLALAAFGVLWILVLFADLETWTIWIEWVRNHAWVLAFPALIFIIGIATGSKKGK